MDDPNGGRASSPAFSTKKDDKKRRKRKRRQQEQQGKTSKKNASGGKTQLLALLMFSCAAISYFFSYSNNHTIKNSPVIQRQQLQHQHQQLSSAVISSSLASKSTGGQTTKMRTSKPPRIKSQSLTTAASLRGSIKELHAKAMQEMDSHIAAMRLDIARTERELASQTTASPPPPSFLTESPLGPSPQSSPQFEKSSDAKPQRESKTPQHGQPVSTAHKSKRGSSISPPPLSHQSGEAIVVEKLAVHSGADERSIRWNPHWRPAVTVMAHNRPNYVRQSLGALLRIIATAKAAEEAATKANDITLSRSPGSIGTGDVPKFPEWTVYVSLDDPRAFVKMRNAVLEARKSLLDDPAFASTASAAGISVVPPVEILEKRATATANPRGPPQLRLDPLQKIAQHVKFAMDETLIARGHSHAVLLEEDLLPAPSFLHLFESTMW